MFKIIYKPSKISSFQQIREFQKQNQIQKIGHSGTLDYLACGLLLIATDEDTKLLPYLQNKNKEYYVKAQLGYVSKTYDEEGPIESFSSYQPNEDEVMQVIYSFLGKIKQIPPVFSAKKIKGKKAYELARKNQTIELKPIDVTIYDIWDIDYQYPFLEFKTKVSNGTYIRSLIHDIGLKLKTGAYITYLERTKIHGLGINDEINVEQLLSLKTYELESDEILKKLFNGLKIKLKIANGEYLLKMKNEIIGIINVENNLVVKQKLFGNKVVELIKI